MPAVGQETWKESDGKSVYVDLSHTVVAAQVAYAESWLGVSAGSGDSGDKIALYVDRQEYQFVLPTALNLSKGDMVHLDTTEITGHTPNDAAYTTTSGANTIPFMKCTGDQDGTSGVVTGILMIAE